MTENEPSAENPLRYNGGYVQHQPHIYIIFWGKNWNERPGTKEKILGLYQWINGSPFGSIFTQYFDYGGQISGATNVAASYTDTRADPQNVNEAAVKAEVVYSIEHQAWPTPSYENQYVVFTTPKASLAAGEEGYCGYHDWWGEGYKGTSLALTFVPWPSNGCYEGGAKEPWQALQITASHEWAETATDPIIYGAYGGWNNTHWVPCPEGYKCSETVFPQIYPVCGEHYCATGEEIADMCYGAEYEGSGVFLNRVWDDYLAKANNTGCVLHDASPARYRVESAGGVASTATHTIEMQGSINPAGYPGSYQFQLYREGELLQAVPNPAGGLPLSFGPSGVNAQSIRVKGSTTYRIVLSSVSQLTTAEERNYYGVTGSFPFTTESTVTTPDWRPVVSTQAATGILRFSAEVNGTVNPRGEDTQYWFEYGTTTSYGQSVPVPRASAGSGTQAVSVSQLISGLQESTTYHFRIVAANGEGTVYGADRTFTTAGIKPLYQSSVGSLGTGNGQFEKPSGTAVDSQGNVYVCDTTHSRIEVFNSQGVYLRQFGTAGAGNGQLNYPRGVALDSKGNVWVADSGNARIEEFNEKGEFVRAVGSAGWGDGQFLSPIGIAVDASNNVWVADTYNSRVQKLNEKGEFLMKFGTQGSAAGQFMEPMAIAVAPDGNVWVADTSNNRVQKFNEKGELVFLLGGPGIGSGAGQFRGPNGITVDGQGTVWVVDWGNARVQELTSKGAYVTEFGSLGTGGGQFQFSSVANGIAAARDGTLWIADAQSNRIQRWISR